MAGKLTSFRIESDSSVWLRFADGSQKTVPAGQLDRFLSGRDLNRVKRALGIRQRYFRRILPPWAKAVTVGFIGLAVAAGSLEIAGWHGQRPVEPVAAGDAGGGDPAEASAEVGTPEAAGPAATATEQPEAKPAKAKPAKDLKQPHTPEHPLERQVMGLVRSLERRLLQ